MIYYYILLFVFGLIFGSFANVLIFRLKKREDMVFKRSYCPTCKKTLKWYDLIPVISFFILRGICRNCRKKISIQYPVVELCTGVMFMIMGYWANSQNLMGWHYIASLIFGLYMAFVFISLFVYDLRYMELPDSIMLPSIVVAIFYFLTVYPDKWLQIMIGIGVSFVFFLLIFVFSKGKAMGGGDVKLAVLIGAICVWPGTLLALLLAFVGGAIIGIILVMAKKKKMKSEIPFGVFIIPSIVIVMIWGDLIVDWYLKMLSL